jgi:hypothetical protein
MHRVFRQYYNVVNKNLATTVPDQHIKGKDIIFVMIRTVSTSSAYPSSQLYAVTIFV